MKKQYTKFKSLASILLVGQIAIITGCAHTQVTESMPIPQSVKNATIGFYPLENYTDTPQAGLRAANIVEGVMIAKGYTMRGDMREEATTLSFKEKLADAKRDGVDYLLSGGVSEWRYKTGIDGEPAVSLHLKLVNVRTGDTVWSALGSDSSWGNASVGTVAQTLISTMLTNSGR